MVRAALALVVLLAVSACGSGDEARPAQAPSAVVWLVGDAATKGDDARAVAATVSEARVDRLVYLGDVYEHGTPREFRRWYDPLYGSLADRTWPLIGNHEWRLRRRGFDAYWRRKVGHTFPRSFERTLRGWRLLFLTTEGSIRRQARWLRARVGAPGTCRLAFTHKARFSAGRHHGDQPDIAPLFDPLRGRAVATFAGHEHTLQRLRPVGGVVQFVVGSGGRVLHRLDRGDPRLAFGDDKSFGALRLTLEPGRAQYEFVAAGGRVLDRGELRCDDRG